MNTEGADPPRREGELEAQLTNLIREFLLTLRSLIDWYLERLDKPRRQPEVEDIPID
ncbi:MAG TPA: hypothetical protein VGF25_20370 [Thermoleophilaceae bacterium]|jgi:hypothetical protein